MNLPLTNTVENNMNSETRLIMELWEGVRDTIPAPKRVDIAMQWLRSFEEYGIDNSDFADVVGEDKYLEEAYNALFAEDPDDSGDNYDENGYGDEEE